MKVEIGPFNDGGDEGFERVEDVHIDGYDVWSLDHSLALIILPSLKMLRENNQSAPLVDEEDVPSDMRPTEAEKEAYTKTGMTDGKHFDRWNYVIDQMIWSFERIVDDEDGNQFHTGTIDTLWQPLDENHEPIGQPYRLEDTPHDEDDDTLYEMVKGPNDTSEYEFKGHKEHNERILVGTTLFGKYYRGLWT